MIDAMREVVKLFGGLISYFISIILFCVNYLVYIFLMCCIFTIPLAYILYGGLDGPKIPDIDDFI